MKNDNDYIICPDCGERVSSIYSFCTNCRCPLKKRKARTGIAGVKDFVITGCIVAAAVIMVVISYNNTFPSRPQRVQQQAAVSSTPAAAAVTAEPAQEAQPTAEPTEPPKAASSRGSAAAIPEDVRTFMNGRSMTPNSNIGYDDLAYLTIPYWDFNDMRQEGHMVVAAELAEEVLDIFSELYDVKYPIERMELVDYFFDKQTETLDSPDRASMGNNNTSAFYYRVVSGTNSLSKHALGRAIDINTKVNPFVNGSYVSPANAYKYADRSRAGWTDIEKRAYIGTDTEIYKIFRKYGWVWGGEIWSYQDYQHFQKP